VPPFHDTTIQSIDCVTLQIAEYVRQTPGIYSWEIRERLLKTGNCDRFNLPTVSQINRIQQRIARSSQPASDCKSNYDDDVTGKGKSKGPLATTLQLTTVPKLAAD